MEICKAREWLINIFSTNIVASHRLLFDKAIRLNKQNNKKANNKGVRTSFAICPCSFALFL